MPNPNAACTLDSLRVQLEAVADELAEEMCEIIIWLHDGGVKPQKAFNKITDDLNETRFLCGEIERLTTKAEK